MSRLHREEVARLQELERRGKKLSPRLIATVRELEILESKLAGLSRLEPVKAATKEPPPHFASLQLVSGPGYRDAYRVCVALRKGLRIDGGCLQVSIKDISELYEYWCYLTVLRLLSKRAVTLDLSDLFSVRQSGLRIRLAQGRATHQVVEWADGRKVHVRYNPSYATSPADAAPFTILVPQRPDIMVSLDEPGWPQQHLILDAKYRLDATNDYVKRFRSPGPPLDAINAMHRYRDAILEADNYQPLSSLPRRYVVQAVAVFPYRSTQVAPFDQSLLWRGLERIGVGAIPLLPSHTEYLETWLAKSLYDGGWSLAARAIPHASRDRLRKFAQDTVLIITVTSQEQLDALAASDAPTIDCALSDATPLQSVPDCVGVYCPWEAEGTGAVTHLAEVTQRAIKHDAGLVRFRLRPLVLLAPPVTNVDDEPVEQLWTSRLFLYRATVVSELQLWSWEA